MIVLDASVLIAHLEAADAQHDRAVQVLTDVAQDAFGISPLTLAEVLVGPVRAAKLSTAQAALRRLDIDTVPFSSEAPTLLAQLRVDTGLRLPDCCVLLAAQTVSGRIATFDDRLATSADRLGVGASTN